MRCKECGRWITAMDFESDLCNQCNDKYKEEE